MEPYIGQISIMSFAFPPKGWALCNGQAIPITQNQALFSVIGTTYGGDGVSTFNLPDLRGRAATHFGTTVQGATGGQEAVQLQITQMPTHTHDYPTAVSEAASTAVASGGLWATTDAEFGPYYTAPANLDGGMAPMALNITGAGQPHNNMQPSLVVNFIIAVQGIYPNKN